MIIVTTDLIKEIHAGMKSHRSAIDADLLDETEFENDEFENEFVNSNIDPNADEYFLKHQRELAYLEASQNEELELAFNGFLD